MNPVALENFGQTIKILLSGMGGIFTVLILIYIVIKVLVKLFPEK
jgi:Na+-transporting methylmalonyl-CoA/oxaloacetate decarboxylase gamma subunit